jgi:hypothetical protein
LGRHRRGGREATSGVRPGRSHSWDTRPGCPLGPGSRNRDRRLDSGIRRWACRNINEDSALIFTPSGPRAIHRDPGLASPRQDRT